MYVFFIICIHFYKVILTHFKENKKIYMIYKMYKGLLWNMYVLFIIFIHISKVSLTHFKENNKIFMI